MEVAPAYLAEPTRPRLTVVKDDGASYSALPHDIMRDTSLSRDARLLYAILQGHWWQDGACFASHATLASEMGCSTRMLRVYLDELIRAGRVTEHQAGARRQKTYRPASIGTVLPIEAPNAQPASDSMGVNRKFPTGQSEISDTVNRKPASDSIKKTPVKKTPEEEPTPTGLGAAGAAMPATEGQPKAKAQRGTRCPESFDLTERHLTYAASLGFSPDQTRVETDKFLAHHRFKGTVGRDWYAGWQNWLRKALEFSAQRPSRADAYRRSAAPSPASARPLGKPANVRTFHVGGKPDANA